MNKIKAKYILLLYFVSIFLFAFFYFCAWHNNVSSFIINNELNLTSHDARLLPYEYDLKKDIVDIDSFMSLEIYMLSRQKIDTEIQATEKLIEKSTLEVDSLKKIRDSLNIIVWDNYRANLDCEIRKRTKELTDRVEIATITAQTHEEAIQNILFYQKGPGYEEFMFVVQKEMELTDLIYHQSYIYLPSIRMIKYDLETLFYRNRYWRLGYWDMVYFSFLTSTCTSFGDIIPNSTSVRAMIAMQIFISLLFLGIIVNKFVKLFENRLKGEVDNK
jgi:hypothetical protein